MTVLAALQAATVLSLYGFQISNSSAILKLFTQQGLMLATIAILTPQIPGISFSWPISHCRQREKTVAPALRS